MKRSEINAELRWACEVLKKNNITLPRFAYWTMDEWKENLDSAKNIREVMMGWDITDFGIGKYNEIGAVLFTVRNGNLKTGDVPYCEKLIVFHKGQRLPIHHHVDKTEDIIVRAGGDMYIKLWGTEDNGTKNGALDLKNDVEVLSDGVMLKLKAGEEVSVTPGNSMRLTPFMNHEFGSKNGDLIVGEVSKVNDDVNDNYFIEPISRFSEIEEDEEPLYPLCNEYDKWF